MSYVDLIDQYLRVGTAANGPLTMLVDTLDSRVAELKDQGHFVSPHRVLGFVDHSGIGPMLDSRQRVDKQMVELWVTAIFTRSLAGDRDYYVRLAKDDPPDTEVLMIDKETNALEMMRVEVTQYTKYSTSVQEVVAKKLGKRYQEGTIFLVLVEETQRFGVFDLYDFIQKHNPQSHRVAIIGGAEEIGQFRVLHWDTSGETATAVTVDTKDENNRRCDYDGVVFKPPYMARFLPMFPTFIKNVKLRR